MTINCLGQLIDLTTPRVMGILNVTPDSFYDGGKHTDKTSILGQVEQMLTQGATFIDVGGYSSRPGASHVTETEELDRVLPVIEAITQHFPEALISVDTFRSEVARTAVESGAAMINDISAGEMDATMFETIARLNVPYIAMHMQGTPQHMQDAPTYSHVVHEVRSYLSEKIARARSLKIKDIMVDVGFGFGKTLTHNYELLKHLSRFEALDAPILVGISRKSMIYKLLKTSPEHSLNGTTALNTVALLKGAHILRVHDVKEAIECVSLVHELR